MIYRLIMSRKFIKQTTEEEKSVIIVIIFPKFNVKNNCKYF